MASLMDIFRTAPAEHQPATQTPQPQQASPDQPPQAQEPQGLDRFSDLFSPKEGDVSPTNFDPSKLFEMTPESQQALASEIGNMNFVQGAVTPEIAQAIQAGGDEALKAIPALVNGASKQAFTAALQAAMKINQASLTKAAPAMEARMTDILRQRSVESAVKDANPVFSHPAAKPILDALVPQLQARYPKASETEIKQMASDYITDLASLGVPKEESSKKGDTMETDWSSWLS